MTAPIPYILVMLWDVGSEQNLHLFFSMFASGGVSG